MPVPSNAGKRAADGGDERASKRVRPQYGDTICILIGSRISTYYFKQFHEQRDDSREFNVHEDVLRSSEYFQQLFAQDPSKTTFDLQHEDISQENFKVYIDWLYYGEINLESLGGSVNFLNQLSSGPQLQRKRDEAVVRRLWKLALLGLTLDDATFRSHVLKLLQERRTAQLIGVMSEFRPSIQDAVRLWKGCVDSDSQKWIEPWMFYHLSRRELYDIKSDLPVHLMDTLLWRTGITLDFVLRFGLQEEVITRNRIITRTTDEIRSRSAWCREVVRSSCNDDGRWEVLMDNCDPCCFRDWLMVVQYGCIMVSGKYYYDLQAAVDQAYAHEGGIAEITHSLCEVWLLSERMGDSTTQREIMQALLSISPDEPEVMSWSTVKLVGSESKVDSGLRLWLIDTLVSTAGVDNDWILGKAAQLEPILLSQLFVKSMKALQGKMSVAEAKAMRPKPSDLEKYCTE